LTVAEQSTQLVQKLWNYCNILHDDGLSYGGYVEQLTFLLFLKMACEQSRAPFNSRRRFPGMSIGGARYVLMATSWRRMTGMSPNRSASRACWARDRSTWKTVRKGAKYTLTREGTLAKDDEVAQPQKPGVFLTTSCRKKITPNSGWLSEGWNCLPPWMTVREPEEKAAMAKNIDEIPQARAELDGGNPREYIGKG
jgi:hypothetical protein